MYDVAIVGAGIAGMATAARLQASGFPRFVLESHGQPGGLCRLFPSQGFLLRRGGDDPRRLRARRRRWRIAGERRHAAARRANYCPAMLPGCPIAW